MLRKLINFQIQDMHIIGKSIVIRKYALYAKFGHNSFYWKIGVWTEEQTAQLRRSCMWWLSHMRLNK